MTPQHATEATRRRDNLAVAKVEMSDDRLLKGFPGCTRMKALRNKFSTVNYTNPTFILHWLIPSAYGVFAIGFLTSAAVFSAGRAPTWEDGIMTDLLSRQQNPQGWFFSALATVLCAALLLPVTKPFGRGWKSPCRRWAVLGAWLYRLGLIAACAIGITSPFQLPYGRIHVWLAFLAFMSLVAGLAVCLAVASHTRRSPALAMLSALQVVLLLFLAYLFFTPAFFDERLWLLAVCEWGLSALIAASTVMLTATQIRALRG